jgi:hypothetical protein
MSSSGRLEPEGGEPLAQFELGFAFPKWATSFPNVAR